MEDATGDEPALTSQALPIEQHDRQGGNDKNYRCSNAKAIVVASVGVEPTHPCEYRNLNPARLPISPRGLRARQLQNQDSNRPARQARSPANSSILDPRVMRGDGLPQGHTSCSSGKPSQ